MDGVSERRQQQHPGRFTAYPVPQGPGPNRADNQFRPIRYSQLLVDPKEVILDRMSANV